jgi:large subunit ribosomal protein L10
MDKQELAEDYQGGLATASHAFLLGYQGIKVNEVTELRARVRACGGSYQVVKNRVALLAIEGSPLAGLKDDFRGPTAVAYCHDDPVALAKALTEFAKGVPAIVFKGGLLDGRQVAAEAIKDIANLPSREELIARLLFLLQSPMTRLARGLQAIIRDLPVVLNEIAKKREQAS